MNKRQDRRRSPQLRIAVTPTCNLKCFYCRPEGEGRAGSPRESLGRENIAFLVETAAEVGFSSVKFTGGEPLLRRDMVQIIGDTVQCRGINDVQMVTNGTMLPERAHELRDAGLHSITVSLDAESPEVFRLVRGGNVDVVLAGIAAARTAGLPVRINSVITRRNFDEIPGLVRVASRFRASLKLLDLVNLTAPVGDTEWTADFVPFTRVRELLENMGAQYEGIEETPGGVGAPLLSFRMLGGLHVVIKDSLYGLHFGPACKACTKYPCQDAIISLRVTHDGFLKKCLIRDDNLVPIREHLNRRDGVKTCAALKELFDEMTSSQFLPGVWRVPLYQRGVRE